MNNYCHIKDIRINATMDFEGISVEAYGKIAAYLKSLGIGVSEEAFAADFSAGVPESASAAEEEPAGESAGKKEPDWDLIMRKFPANRGRDIFLPLMRDAFEHPENYAWDWYVPAVWKDLVPAFRDIPARSLSQACGMFVKYGITTKTQRKNTANYLMDNYYRLPVPRGLIVGGSPEEAEPRPADVKRGHMLMLARTKHKLSFKDLEDMIGYDANIIANWECGKYTMSPEAEEKIRNLFGADVFEGV